MKPTKKEACSRCTNTACECNDCLISKHAISNDMCVNCDIGPIACIPSFADPCDGCNSAPVDCHGAEACEKIRSDSQ